MSAQANTADAFWPSLLGDQSEGGALALPRDRSWVREVLAPREGASEARDASVAAEAKLTEDERRVRAVIQREAEWVRGANRGSMAAFEQIVMRYQRPVLSLIVRKVRDPGLAEDLAQETFIKAHRALHTFDPSRRLASWLFKIANNTAIDYLRKKQLPTEALDSGDSERRSWIDSVEDDTSLSAQRRIEGQQLGELLAQTMARLRPDYREVLTLRFVEGLSYVEVAEVTGQPLGTVKTKIHRARRELATLLGAKH